jgi:hypothetical protein
LLVDRQLDRGAVTLDQRALEHAARVAHPGHELRRQGAARAELHAQRLQARVEREPVLERGRHARGRRRWTYGARAQRTTDQRQRRQQRERAAHA